MDATDLPKPLKAMFMRVGTRWPWLAIGLLVFPLSVAYALKVHATSDDAYIYLVYVRNLVEGNGLTFNGTVVEGYSSVAWMFLLCVLGLLPIPFLSLPQLGLLLGYASGLFALFTTYHLARRCGLEASWALLPVALLAATGDFAFYMSSGLETVFFVALVPLCVGKLYDDDLSATLRSYAFPLLMTLTILARPEGALLCGLVLLCALISTRSLWLPVRCGLVLSATLAPVFVVRRIHYGYWLPNTYYVKSNPGLASIEQGIDYLDKAFHRYDSIVIVFVLLCAWALWRRVAGRGRDEPSVGGGAGGLVAPLLFICVVWLLQVTVQGGDNLVGSRVLLPVLPLLYVALVLLARRLPLISTAVLTALLCGVLVWRYLGDEALANQTGMLERSSKIYRAAGELLRDRYPPDTLVALNPAGIIPYYSGLPTIDMLGLNDVHIAHHGRRDPKTLFGHQMGDGAYVLARKPDIILFGAALGRNASPYFVSDRQIWASEDFRENYEPVRWFQVGWAWARK
ncbi:MAG: hypothetical protein JRH19_23940 [Deltaproteobacteria bacterium]|nr:hypothetical protein [Deltaproteobacteria bacterium]